MKPHREMIGGPEAYDRFQRAMKAVLSVPHAEIQRKIEEQCKQPGANPNRRGPKTQARRADMKDESEKGPRKSKEARFGNARKPPPKKMHKGAVHKG